MNIGGPMALSVLGKPRRKKDRIIEYREFQSRWKCGGACVVFHNQLDMLVGVDLVLHSDCPAKS